MLDIGSVVSELGQVSSQALSNDNRTYQQLARAVQIATFDATYWSDNFSFVQSGTLSRLTAKPTSTLPIGTAISMQPAPYAYRVIAVDGSQIPIDRHAALPYYLINVGKVILHYGTADPPLLSSTTKLYYLEDDLLIKDGRGEMSYRTESGIAEIRTKHELSALIETISNSKPHENSLAFVDGTLILWAQDPQVSRRHKDPAIADLCSLLSLSKMSHVLTIGYVSRPSSRDVVNVLRLVIGDDGVTPVSDENLMDRINDEQLFSKILQPLQRSIVFESTAKVLTNYKPIENRISFFYLNTGTEVARIEFPSWCTTNKEDLDLIHAIVLDQIHKGHGYPVALMEAHELAVVRSSDLIAVERLIENELLRSNIRLRTTNKSLAKRIRPI